MIPVQYYAEGTAGRRYFQFPIKLIMPRAVHVSSYRERTSGQFTLNWLGQLGQPLSDKVDPNPGPNKLQNSTGPGVKHLQFEEGSGARF